MRNICLLLAIVFVGGYFGECKGADPAIYVKIKFSFTWTEMCSLANYLKVNIGKEIVMNDNTGSTLPPNKIVLHNFDDYCPKGAYKKANVYIFASKFANDKSIGNIDEEMTKQIFKVVDYYFQQKIESYLGSLFVGKIESVEIAGKNAPEKSTDYTEVEKLYIALGIGLIILVVIIAILALVVYFKNRKNKDKNDDRYVHRPAVESSSAKENVAYEGEGNSRNSDLQTRF